MIQAFFDGLAASGDPARAEHALGYFPTAMRHLGVTTPRLRACLQPLVRAQRAAPDADVVFALWSNGIFEARQAAYQLLESVPRLRRSLSREAVLALAAGNDNWCSVDTYGTYLAGPAWREGVLTDADIAAWSASPDRWLRRTAIVSTIALNIKARGGRGDVPRTLAVCARHVSERDDMVQKGLSWAVRACIEHDAEAVAEFLTEHDAALAGRVKREVRNKLRTGKKNP
ncbi:hypothetical protein LBMAG42_10770 [Deltaproteobacteria bacterium]|nr:hypothetical protein LBMAG42_10770 [Deltaproteobacteria bacterium]